MELSAKLVRSQLNFFKPFVAGCSLETTRKGQDKLGELMSALHKREVIFRDHDFEQFKGAWVMPKDERRSGVVLYLHGGGYTCGSLDYAKGFAATLASECGVRVFCGAYRLAPEDPYPAALEDALTAYDYLLKKGYAPQQILLCGESAGGGLICALCLKLKQLGRELPCGLIAISPWVDLTGSGKSYEFNRDNDPSLTEELLQFYARCYTQDPTDPLCSPLLGDLTGSGRTELAVAAATSEPGGLSLQLFVPDGRAMTAAQGVELDERLEKCTALYATRCGAARGLIVDGSVSSGAASQLLCWEDGVLFPYPDKEEGGDVFARSQRSRTLSALGPQDLLGTGEVLIPEVGASIATLQSARRFYPVEWMNYLCEQPLQQFGVYDADHNYFVRLPTEWQDNMTVSAQSESDWQIRSKEDNSLLCAVRVADRAAANGTYTQAAQLAEKKVLVYFGESCTAVQANLIRRGVAVLG
jgi:acetyl esterase/lipase